MRDARFMVTLRRETLKTARDYLVVAPVATRTRTLVLCFAFPSG